MRAMSVTAGEKANAGVVDRCPPSATCFPLFSRLANALRGLWDRDHAKRIANLTGTSERTVKYWLAAETGMSLENLAALLDTPQGFAILEAVMGDSRQPWWISAKLANQSHRQKIEIRKAQQRLEELKALRAQLDMFEV